MNKQRKYFITGGGTGGHIYPAIAVADGLLNLEDTDKIYYVGNPKNMEYTIASNKNYTFLPVSSSGMPRKLSFALFKWGIQMFCGWLKCCMYIKKYKPDAIFGTGGYVSAPVLFAGITKKVPIIMHDCDANPGLVTRKLAPFANSVSIAFDAAKEKLNNPNCHINGNPIRNSFSELKKDDARKELGLDNKLTLCIMGGSQGAKKINEAIVVILKKLLEEYNLQIIFQTGKKNYEETISKIKEIYPAFESNKNLIIRPYFEDMVTVLKASDIAISRAGSLSISELCASSVATIFIPYPYAAADHQRKNAKYMVEKGAGLYLENDDTNSENLENLILKLINNPRQLEELQQNASKLAKYDGTEKIIEQIKSCIN